MKHAIQVTRIQTVLIEVVTDSDKYALNVARLVATEDGENLSWKTASIDVSIDGKTNEA